MNIESIKQSIAKQSGIELPVLDLSRQFDVDDKPTEWLGYWDNTKRVRISVHQDVVGKIKADKSFDKLAVKYSLEESPKGQFSQFTIITPRNIEESL